MIGKRILTSLAKSSWGAARDVNSRVMLLNLNRFYSDNPTYNTIPQVFDRIGAVADEKIVAQVKALFQFNLSNDTSYFVDLKNGAGKVGKGVSPEKPDVTITMEADNLLKMFNRELLPTTAFMTGKLTVKGDLTKALTLEKVMKAAREAAD
eukprot:GFUD01133917.1.p1 GENE.GFUD01133917.1~~GFUD01133917.1.p1  ORF type:complete len:151 (+),score=40.46 GFUD01133917.1:63-515(+)